MGSCGKKKPNQSVNSIAPRQGVSVRVTTQAKKIATTVTITVRMAASAKVLPSAARSEGSAKAVRQASRPHVTAWPAVRLEAADEHEEGRVSGKED